MLHYVMIIHIACYINSFDIVKLLIEKVSGVNTDYSGCLF